MNRAALRAQTLTALQEDRLRPIAWTLDEIDGHLNDALALMAEQVPFVKRQYVIPRRTGHVVYDLQGISADIMAPYRLWLPDLHRKLEATTLPALDSLAERWWTIHGSPWCWAPVDWQRFVIWPVPATTEGWIEVDCYSWPPVLLDDGDEPELLPASQVALTEYSIGMGHLKSWDAEGATRYLQRFLGARGPARGQQTVAQTQERSWRREQQEGR